MKKLLVVLVLVLLVLAWNFVFSPSKKLDLTDPAKVLQGLSLAIKHKLAVQKYHVQNARLPTAEDWKNLADKPEVDTSRSLVRDIRIGENAPGAITVYFSNKDVINVAADIDGKWITLMPFIIDGKINWTCRGNINEALMPTACNVINNKEQDNDKKQ